MKERLLDNIEPKEVLRYFEDLTFIPRESGNEQQVTDYLLQFAISHRLEYVRDESLNVLMRKPASLGYENHPGVILQAHVDMVCEKRSGVDINFAIDPICFEVDGDRIISKDTTLGADDGIGVAYILALLADDSLQHPAIEALFSTDEERGMVGIGNFDFTQLKGFRLINIDSADEGTVVVGCAGGPMIQSHIPLLRFAADQEKAYFQVHVNDLMGGHSGEDIHRNRANANKLLGDLLSELQESLFADIADFRGGQKTNAIPRGAHAIIGIDSSKIDEMDRIVGNYAIKIAEKYEFTDPDISIYCADAPVPEKVLTPGSAKAVLNFITDFPNGVIRMDAIYPTQVETSANLGIVRIYENAAEIWTMVRSSNEREMRRVTEKIEDLTKDASGKLDLGPAFPAWQFDPASPLKKTFDKVYRDLYEEPPKTVILHAGLEPGIFEEKMNRTIEMISLGPNVRNLHAPGEYVTISSCRRLWETLRHLIAAL